MLPISGKPEIGALVYTIASAAWAGSPPQKNVFASASRGFLTANLVSLKVRPTKPQKNGE